MHAEKKLKIISLELTELGGDQLGVDEVAAEAYDIGVTEGDDNQEDNAGENNVDNVVTKDDNQEDEADKHNVENAASRRSHSITIKEDDKGRLEPGEFLNDSR
eukprot:scaffold30569_cov78-Cyclotella_meneghiniana.AAC.1